MPNPNSFLSRFALVQCNVNSLFINKLKCKLNNGNLDRKSILFLADTRVSEDRLKFILDKFNLENRFFTTISKVNGTHCRAGCSLLFPPDFIEKIIKIELDSNPVPRYIFITIVNREGCKITYGSIYGPANGKTQVKLDFYNKINQILDNIEIQHYFANEPFNVILGGDFNLHLDKLNKSSVGTRLNSLMSRFECLDVVAEFSVNTYQFATYIGNHKQAKPSRIDGIFISRKLLTLLKTYNSCTFSHRPGLFETDHFPVCIEFIINKTVPLEDCLVGGDDSYMEHPALINRLDKVATLTLSECSPLNFYFGGNLSRCAIDSMSEEELDLSYQNAHSNFPLFNIFYKLIDNLIKVQNDFKSECLKKDYANEKSLKIEFTNIMRKNYKSNLDIKKIKNITCTLQDNKREFLFKQAKKKGLKACAFGETVTRFFLTQHTIKRSKLRIKQLQLEDGEIVIQPTDIAEGLNCAYKKFFTTKDCYKKGDLNKFLGESGIELLGKISPADSVLCDSSFTMLELENIIKKIKTTSKGGYDKVTGALFHYIFRKCKHLILN